MSDMSPHKGPVIPEGLATKLGKYGAAGTILLALIVELANVNLSEDTEKLALGALSLILTTIAGRMAQSTALLRDAPSPAQQALLDNSGEPDESAQYEDVPAPEFNTSSIPPDSSQEGDPNTPPGLER